MQVPQMQRPVRRAYGSVVRCLATAFAVAGGSLVGVVVAGRPGIAQMEVVSTETMTTLHASAPRSLPGAAVTFTVRIEAIHAQAAYGAVPGGLIDFVDETTARVLGRAEAAHPSITVSDLAAGAHQIRAYYRGTSAFMPAIVQPSVSHSIAHHVLAAPEVSLLAAYNGGGTVELMAQVTAKGVPLRGSVTFRDGASVLAGAVQLDSSGRAIFITSALTDGSHTFVAEYSGDVLHAPGTAETPKVVHGAIASTSYVFSNARE